MKKIWISALAILMLVRAEPAQALSWADFCTYAGTITNSVFTKTFDSNAPKLALGGVLMILGLTGILMSLKKDKVNKGNALSHAPRHA
jgi:hypothetical protein